ncbi:MAG TPA: N,N-dimethylformamidase beta subunit family domain-containing protein, partial [Acidimicrobiales bacterium]|nr:N,N-dimethylformamidase beta subunit family domain-containing protein [Acidimicrobiales bacterium]
PWVAGLIALAVLAALAVGVGAKLTRKTARKPAPAASGNPSANEFEGTTAAPAAPVEVVAAEIGPNGVVAAWVKAENAKPGSSGWRLTKPAQRGEIEGYADRVSITPGQPVSLYVSTAAPTFHVEAYRMGFYQGQGARLVWKSDDLPGTRQAKPAVQSGTNMVEAKWQPSLTVTTDAGWPQGDYLLKLVASTGLEEYVPLTLRNDTSTAAYEVINAVTTWQAYNLWGGYDLYEGLNGKTSDAARRSRIVSFDRPYKNGDGQGDFLGLEYPLVSLVESLGLDVTYVTDTDVHEQPQALQRHRAVFSMGHDEYYSMAMRQALEQARDHGVNLAFLGANAMFRHIRFQSSPLGPDRHEVNYRIAHDDPLYGVDNADVTVDWRDPPNNQPEGAIIGDFYQCNPVRADMVVTDPSNWLFAGTGAYQGQRLAGVVGSEYDRYDPTSAHPDNVEILTHSPLTCRGKPDYSDATYYTAASHAGVFASGTIDLVGFLDVNCPCAGHVVGRLVENLLVAFGTGPAGVAHPSIPNTNTTRSAGPPVTAAGKPASTHSARR